MLTFPKRPLFSLLAVSTLALIVFSYLFTLALCVGVVSVPLLALLHRFHSGIGDFTLLIILGVGLATAGTIGCSILPRRHRWEPTGIELDLAAQPRLLSLVEEITSLFGEQKPNTLYLTTEASAWVKERNGFLSFQPRQRILGLGLPILATMTVDQLRAVLAHEYAHFHEGDTRLTPLPQAARAAMGRTLRNLSSGFPILKFVRAFVFTKLVHDLVVLAVRSYWTIFFRVSQSISRRQEYRSDELAACVAGTEALREGLKTAYWNSEVVHVFWVWIEAEVLRAGFLPPLTAAFRDFASVPAIAEASKIALASMMANSKAGPYDSHPPLSCRLKKIERLRLPEQVERDTRPAMAMLDDLPALERKLVQAQKISSQPSDLQAIGWEDVGTLILLPRWQKFVCEHQNLLEGYCCTQIPELLQELPGLVTRIHGSEDSLLTREQRIDRAADLIWMALAIAMIGCNWKLVVHPGLFYLEREGSQVNPYEKLQQLRAKAISASEWTLWCDRHGCGTTLLGSGACLSSKK